MADLVMTIDSDSDSGQRTAKASKKKEAKQKQTLPVDEEILLAHSVILQDTNTNESHMKKKHTAGYTVGSNNLWGFTDSLVVDGRRDGEYDTTADDQAPFLQSTEQRVSAKMAQHKVSLPEELENFKVQAEKELADGEEEVKEDPTIHYDKEDLISFH